MIWDRGRNEEQPERRIAQRDLILFTRQLAALIEAGVALDRALGLIADGRSHAAGRRDEARAIG